MISRFLAINMSIRVKNANMLRDGLSTGLVPLLTDGLAPLLSTGLVPVEGRSVDATSIQVSAKNHIETALWLSRVPSACFTQNRPPYRMYGYLDCLRDIYEALNFLGVSIGFLTERQLLQGVPEGTKLLIVPNAMYEAAPTVTALKGAVRKQTLSVRIIGPEILMREPTGNRRPDPELGLAWPLSLVTPQTCHPVLNQWIEESGIPRKLLDVDDKGNPIWGIEVRTAQAGADRLAYLINERRDPVQLQLK